jgi:hypothetical protein
VSNPLVIPPKLLVPAHVQHVTHSYWVNYPDHEPRESDPHYVDFHHWREETKATAKCLVGAHRNDYSECDPPPEHWPIGLEVHHSIIEFAVQNAIDLKWLEVDFPGISDRSQIGAWVESPVNLEWRCVLPGTMVLMTDGSHRPIEYVVPGDSVRTHDGSSGLVGAVSRKRYRGETVRFGGAEFTALHRILTHRGWLTAAQILHEVRMHGPHVILLRGEQQQVVSSVVGSIAIDMVDTLARQQGPSNDPCHNVSMFHNPSGRSVAPHRHSDITLSCDMPVGAVCALLPVQSDNTAIIGTVEIRASAPMCFPVEADATDQAFPKMRWVAAMLKGGFYTGWVHDLSISHNHSFIAGGIAVHNCVFHHRGVGGVHTLTASDYEGVKYARQLTSRVGE